MSQIKLNQLEEVYKRGKNQQSNIVSYFVINSTLYIPIYIIQLLILQPITPMGSSQPKQQAPTLEDTLIDMKIASKRMARESTKSMKDSQNFMKKAKDALRKNNQEGAKLYLQSAAAKRTQSMNIQRMGLKMQYIAGNMKTMQNNQQIMSSFQKMAALVGGSMNVDFENMANNMQNLQKCMDEMTINTKMMEELMTQDQTTDVTADQMLNVLKGELAMETENQVNEAALIQQREMQFQDELKKL